MTRAILLLLPLALAGCGPSAEEKAVEALQRRDATDDERLACARGAAELAPTCVYERTDTAEGLVLTIRHPDGAFRRLLVTKDGRGVVAADGAEPARVAVVGPDRIEVAIAGERYRLPATVRGAGAAR